MVAEWPIRGCHAVGAGRRFLAGRWGPDWQPWPPGRGMWAISTRQVYTSRGIGLIAPPLRFNCRPELALLTLVPET